MSSTPEQSWPFLAVLMSSSPPDNDDDEELARVRGLGFIHGDVIVTTAHIAADADVAKLHDETMPLKTRQTAAEGELAVVKLSGEPRPRLTVRQLSEGEPVTVAIVKDLPGSVRLVSGHVAPSERLTVTLDSPLGEDWSASGSPVVAGDDALVGIVGPFETNTSVSAFGADTVRQLLEAHESGLSACD